MVSGSQAAPRRFFSSWCWCVEVGMRGAGVWMLSLSTSVLLAAVFTVGATFPGPVWNPPSFHPSTIQMPISRKREWLYMLR